MDVVFGLCVIFKYGIGIDFIDIEVVKVCGIVVKVVVGVNVLVVVEYIWVFIMVCVKSVVGLDQCMCEGYWDKFIYKSLELCGCMLGLVGIGVIVCCVVVVVVVLEMLVLVYDLYVKDVL